MIQWSQLAEGWCTMIWIKAILMIKTHDLWIWKWIYPLRHSTPLYLKSKHSLIVYYFFIDNECKVNTVFLLCSCLCFVSIQKSSAKQLGQMINSMQCVPNKTGSLRLPRNADDLSNERFLIRVIVIYNSDFTMYSNYQVLYVLHSLSIDYMRTVYCFIVSMSAVVYKYQFWRRVLFLMSIPCLL